MGGCLRDDRGLPEIGAEADGLCLGCGGLFFPFVMVETLGWCVEFYS